MVVGAPAQPPVGDWSVGVGVAFLWTPLDSGLQFWGWRGQVASGRLPVLCPGGTIVAPRSGRPGGEMGPIGTGDWSRLSYELGQPRRARGGEGGARGLSPV